MVLEVSGEGKKGHGTSRLEKAETAESAGNSAVQCKNARNQEYRQKSHSKQNAAGCVFFLKKNPEIPFHTILESIFDRYSWFLALSSLM